MDLIQDLEILDDLDAPKLTAEETEGARKVYIETYGCQMNVSDSEIVAAILRAHGYGLTRDPEQADVVLLNTCAIREHAEQKVRHRLDVFRAHKRKRRPGLRIGVLGCMAERLRHKLLEEEQLVDLVVGPDAYRDLPRLLEEAETTGQAAVNVQLSREETYADIAPVRYDSNGVTAYVSIMRGCDNMCAFCVVPFTRGRERSRPVQSILDECARLVEEGYREVTVLGQNVNSYRYTENGTVITFPELLYRISLISPELRVRYSTSHPKDCSDELLHVHRERHNVCNYIHLPVQHGNTNVLRRMRRTYTREQYLALVARARRIVPGISLSTDIIAGFCGETEAEHQDTLSLLEEVRFDHAYMFLYSERPGTYAARKYKDDVPLAVKKRRLQEIIALQTRISLENNQKEIGRVHTVLVEGPSKRSPEQLCGRTDTNKMVVFDRQDFRPGEYVRVRITDCTSATLLGEPLGRTTLSESAQAAPTLV
ncbi:tRNA (N6-isopentenyl adenosine(37)-C2)-methylthiotransferase MiaB [Rhodothermus profundi]|uniref:tRNA-2-methylthio-N(6)-dimethylallyladenosine synthase n=1 Tax=Rhodothermus profundi TaxID=633813 RepID=A0A1M6UCG2_9BACT|nr:tRNA (N6-isopentenyl adenosine(37)-C2)-methylthiotransferase MiaB [Rhodothermus profundi]SHK66738.1 tRNA-i(6)A37 thiotransferase enzyme MiaB [Rhodothermus profundi]